MSQWRAIVPFKRDFSQLWQTFRNALLKRDDVASDEKYNGAQRIAYSLVILLGAVLVLSGLAIWKPTSLPWITALMGGYEAARFIHFWATMAFCLFIFIHVIQVVRAGWSTMKSIVTGFEVVDASRTPKETQELESEAAYD